MIESPGAVSLLTKIEWKVQLLKEKNGGKEVDAGLILSALAYLSKNGEEIVEGKISPLDFIEMSMFFNTEVVKPIKEFTTDEDEQLELIAKFMKFVVVSFTNQFVGAFVRSRQQRVSTSA